MSSTDTRKKIAKAAISLFLQHGYAGTSITDIRKTSGATTGSIYHFFGNKAGIAIFIWEDAIAGWKSRFQDMNAPTTAEAQIKATVCSLLEWARDNRAHFRVYDEILFLARSLEDFDSIMKAVEQGHAISSKMYSDWVKVGDVLDLPWPLARALMMGPSLEFLRTEQPFGNEDATALAQAAWASVRRPASSRRAEA